MSLSFRLLPLCCLLSNALFAQNLPLPAELPSTPKPVVKPTPVKPAPVKPVVPPVVVITDSPPRNTGEIIGSVPVRGPGPSVGGVAVFGLTDLVALGNIKAAWTEKLQSPVTLSDGAKTWTLTREAVGATIPYRDLLAAARTSGRDVPVRFEVDFEAAKTALQKLAKEIERTEPPAKDAQTGTKWTKFTLAIEGSAWRVKQAIEARPPQLNADLVVAKTPVAAPALFAEAPEGFPHLLAAYDSRYDARLRGRTNNLKLAAEAVNGTIVEEGAIFSANKAIGPRTIEDGWKEAQMFVSGQVVKGVGAGICQCASTVYNAALLAGLTIVERHPHMFRVSYVAASRDATIYWGGKDFRFKNTSGGTVYVETFLRKGRFHARLWGTAPRQGEYKVESVTISKKENTVSEAYRTSISPEGKSRVRLSRDVYKPHP